jgi:hypothetical protein
MLFLYRIQNDPTETPSFNAFQIEGDSLNDLAVSLSKIFQQDYRTQFVWRVRKSDSTFGYVWKDVGGREFDQPLDGDMAMVRLLRTATLTISGDRVPTRFVGNPNDAVRTDQTTNLPSTKQVASKPDLSKKRAQETTQDQPKAPAQPNIPIKNSTNADFTNADTLPQPSKKSSGFVSAEPDVPDELDGMDAEERARIRIQEREQQERAEMERKVMEVRAADEAQAMNADAKQAAWNEMRAKLEKWSGTEKDRKPIRVLLCTMQNVLWEGSKWTPTSVIVRPNEVRIAYRKAMLIVHPDKIAAGSSPHIQVIAKYCFENLNAAYEKFEATELKTGS